jgi:Predicted DNA modification methylase
MNSRYFAPHAAGFGPLVARLAERDCPGAKARPDGDNAILIECPSEPSAVLSYCRGLFRVLGEERGGLEAASRRLAKSARVPGHAPQAQPEHAAQGRDGRRYYGPRSFVLRSFGPDDPAPIPREAKLELEGLISRATGARPDSAHPEREYRLQERSDGRVLFLERITRSGAARGESAAEAELRAGELPRTTCRLLAEMTGPEEDDVFLDPFCGYGGIVLERAIAHPYKFAFAQDLDPGKVAAVKESLGGKSFEKRRKTIFPKARDALDPGAFDPGFVSAIATDPPWGLYEGGGLDSAGAQALLGSFLVAARRMLSPGGRLVLLVSRELDVGALVRGMSGGAGRSRPMPLSMQSRDEGSGYFAQRESYDVLVSGKKARAIRFDRA